MKANELMIGDWVFNAHHGENIQITPYDFFTHGHFEDGKYIPTGVTPSNGWDLDPIPITPEILEKNGFKVMHGFGYSEKYPTYDWGYHKGVRDYASVDVTFYNEPIAGVSTLVRMETNSSKGDGVNTFHSCDCDYVHQLQNALRLCGIEKEIVL